MKTTYESTAGPVDLGSPIYHHDSFGYTLFEEIVDPADPEGPRALAMHVPAHSLSKTWLLIGEDYSERVELLSGSASLVVGRTDTNEWTTIPLDRNNPTADGVEIKQGDVFCIVTDDEEAVVLSRPSKPFDISYEAGVTSDPEDSLSRFILAHVAAE